MESGRHVVSYREDEQGILVSRILHQRMLPERLAEGVVFARVREALNLLTPR
jgi:hypothetical protein